MALVIEEVNDKTIIRVHGGTVSSTRQIITNDEELIYIQAVHWVNISTAGHILELQNGAQETILKLTADAPGTNGKLSYAAEFPNCLVSKGLRIVDMDSGEILIYKKMI